MTSDIDLPSEPDKASRQTQKRARATHDAIAAIVQDIPRGVHLTAPEVYRRARESGLQVSLSTVYRTLNVLQAGGDVSTVAGDHGRRYEAKNADHDHDHLICLKCGLTIEFEDDLIRGFGKSLAERKGYEHQSSRFDILGICPECKAKDEDHKISTCIDALKTSAELLDELRPQISNCIMLLETRKLAKSAELCVQLINTLQKSLTEMQIAAETLKPTSNQ